mgnify:CR=1 FL=1|tara:strand:+ start:10261 stop:12057 length:1797 start_codon:yes stop_codon:yes gene_type:complete
MPDKKTKPVRYASKEFDTIKQSLVDYAKSYYPDTYKDFNAASFGSLMLDMVAYVGDMLSFYVDYQANESFLDSAIETKNLLKLAKQFGYKRPLAYSSTGKCAFYVQVPAQTSGEPNTDLIPILKEGTRLSSAAGVSFTLTDDVDFSKSDSEVVVARVDTNGIPTSYAYKAYGNVVSGDIETEVLSVPAYQRFLKLSLEGQNITEIISVVDSEGNEYFEVPYLSHNIVYRAIRNPSLAGDEDAPYILREKLASRRFIVEVNEDSATSLQFGYGSESSLKDSEFPDPSSVALQRFARKYYSDDSFDPSTLLKTDKFGIVPPTGKLVVTYRKNQSDSVNIPVNSVNSVDTPIVTFSTDAAPSSGDKQSILSSFDVENEEAILGQVNDLKQEEIRIRAINAYSSQNRAVTRQDYISLIYRMPSIFGAVKRANIVQDKDSFKRNLNLYVVSEDIDGDLTTSSSTIKENLKVWLSQYKMVNDTIDILDGQVVNFEIQYKVLGALDSTQAEILAQCNSAVKAMFEDQLLFGSPFYISDIYKTLNDLDSVVDAQDVKILQKYGTEYSTYNFDIDGATTDDNRFIIVPENVILELKFPNDNIVGVVV